MLYFLDRVAREFVEVLRSYSFQGYRDLKFLLSQDGKIMAWAATREDLELFRRHKKTLASILRFSENVPDSVEGGGVTGSSTGP